jgi:uncharacterized protein involved in exopolysaccharide biosynthesis
MSEDSTTGERPIATHEEGETTLLDLLIVLAKHKRLVLGMPLSAAIVAVVVTLLMPNIYTGTTRILPPQQSQSSATALLAQFGALMGGGGGASPLALRNPNDLYVGMLKSRTIADGLISRFELQKLYDEDTMVETRKELAKKTTIGSGKDGIITIEFEDEDPKRAAAVANAYVEELYKLTTSVAVTEASQRRLFFETQLKQTRDQLAQAEFGLRQAIDKGGLAGVDVQSRAILEPSAQLRAQIALREVQLGAIRIFATDQHPDIERLRHEIASMKRELSKLEGGDAEAKPANATSAGFENLRRFKDFKFLERLTELLTQQFEAAKIDEAKDISIVQVLDKAVEPDKKSKPKRTLITAATAIVGGFVAVFWAFIAEVRERTRKDPKRARQLELLDRHIRARLFGRS